MLRYTLFSLALAAALQTLPTEALGFCGFYVAKADASLFNQASQVILARNGNQTSVTMANDFQGKVQDFALVVPVPHVLKREQIKIVERRVFDYLDAYSGPRLVEYYDDNPCYSYDEEFAEGNFAFNDDFGKVAAQAREAKKMGVTIEATYTVGEYDILILSGEDSKGLVTWLNRNGYQLPKGAKEVVTPYIKSGMKFFVVKVNLEAQAKKGLTNLRPIQITYNSPQFMLPIRLGMANSTGWQDLVVYALSNEGRVEPVNYRMVELPTDYDIPLSVQEHFGPFYKALFDKAWDRQGRTAAVLEYFWNISGENYTKCDPCVTQPPTFADLTDAGVHWLSPVEKSGWRGSDYDGTVYITRLHFRYNRELYPEDLRFQVTPGRSNFQGRYVMHHPVEELNELNCDAGQRYLQELQRRYAREERNLRYLTGWTNGHPSNDDDDDSADGFAPIGGGHNGPTLHWGFDPTRLVVVGAALTLLLLAFVLRNRRKRVSVHAA